MASQIISLTFILSGARGAPKLLKHADYNISLKHIIQNSSNEKSVSVYDNQRILKDEKNNFIRPLENGSLTSGTPLME